MFPLFLIHHQVSVSGDDDPLSSSANKKFWLDCRIVCMNLVPCNLYQQGWRFDSSSLQDCHSNSFYLSNLFIFQRLSEDWNQASFQAHPLKTVSCISATSLTAWFQTSHSHGRRHFHLGKGKATIRKRWGLVYAGNVLYILKVLELFIEISESEFYMKYEFVRHSKSGTHATSCSCQNSRRY